MAWLISQPGEESRKVKPKPKTFHVKQLSLFEDKTRGAEFSECGKYRYKLWRLWDNSKPLVMFIGLNPSKANATENDNTIDRVEMIAKHNGFGGFYMLNCFPFISTNPDELWDLTGISENEKRLFEVAEKCKEIVFAWGNFKIIQKLGIDTIMKTRFPGAKALVINKNGSPKHPLYCKAKTDLIPFN